MKNTGEVDAMVRVKVFAPVIDGLAVTETAGAAPDYAQVKATAGRRR